MIKCELYEQVYKRPAPTCDKCILYLRCPKLILEDAWDEAEETFHKHLMESLQAMHDIINGR
jgi:hypothetical protein